MTLSVEYNTIKPQELMETSYEHEMERDYVFFLFVFFGIDTFI